MTLDPEVPHVVTKRLFVGGLSSDVSKEDIIERFSRFGKIDNVKLTTRTDDKGLHVKSFVHLDLEGEEAKLKKCFDTYQNTKWKGSVLKLQYAKESFLDRLKKEREEELVAKINKEDRNSTETLDPLPRAPDISDINGPAVPGTLLPGKTNWVVGKYGRVLPVMKLKKSSKLKTIKHDPSKYCHAAKIFKDDTADSITSAKCEQLTWEITTPDSDIVKKRKGEFPPTENVKKVKVVSSSQPTLAVKNSSSFDQFTSNNIKAKKEDEIEIVKQGFNLSLNQTANTKKSKFDSDMESDEESKSTSLEPKKNQTKSHFETRSAINPQNNIKPLHSNGGLKNQPSWKKIPEFQGLKMLGIQLGNSEIKPDKKSSASFSSDLSTKDQSVLLTPKEAGTKNNFPNDKNSNPVKNYISPTKHQELPVLSSPSTKAKLSEPSDSFIKGFSNIADQLSSSLTSLQDHVNSNNDVKKAVNKQITPSTTKSNLVRITSLTKSQPISLLLPSDSSHQNKKLNEQAHQVSSFTASCPDHSDSDEDGDSHSVSSADTDEIIARYKKNCNLSHSSFSSSIEKKIHSLKTKPAPSRSLNTSLSNNSFYTSEYFDDSLGLSDYSLPNVTMASNVSDDSDLDSNDFELVAKRLEKKASLSSASNDKSVQKEKETSNTTHDSAEILKIPKYCEEQKNEIINNVNQFQKDKKTIGNEKRLKALNEAMKMKQQQQMLIQKALQNVDSKDHANRIVFNSDSEEESAYEILNVETAPPKENQNKKKSNLNLFDSSSESDTDIEEKFQSKSHFEGKKGEKLMQMESKFGDSRFKLDAKFADSESDSDSDVDKTNTEIDNTLEEEKAASLKVLEKVVGKSNLDRFSEKMKRNTKHIIDMNTVRFDPTKVLPQKEVTKLAQTKSIDVLSNNKATSTVREVKKNQHMEEDKAKIKNNKTESEKSADKAKSTILSQKTDKKSEISAQKTNEKADLENSETSGKSRVHLDKSLVNLFKSDKAEDKFNGKMFSLLEQFGNNNSSDDSSASEMETSQNKDTKSKNISSENCQATPTETAVMVSNYQKDDNQMSGDESDGDVSLSESLSESENVEIQPGMDSEPNKKYLIVVAVDFIPLTAMSLSPPNLLNEYPRFVGCEDTGHCTIYKIE
ncbi:hypothetical protein Btru_043791 [Bulinus truncatus]|nr:hypothetical protein Btru_043791 [Bulinus truncatus]